MSFTNYLETEILDHVFGGNAYTAPGTHYLALYTAAPGETGGGLNALALAMHAPL